MSKVFITDYITKPDIETSILGEDLSNSSSKSIEVLLVWHQKIDAQYLDNYPNLRGVVRYGVGFDNIDLNEIRRRNLVFCNTPDYGTDEVSDSALSMILNHTRGVHAYNQFSKKYFDSWQENIISAIRRTSEISIGVIGAGRIGTALIRKAFNVGFKVSFFDPYKPSGYEKAIRASRFYDMDSLLNNSDVISIHTPLTSETRGMVDKEFLRKMKKGAVLINTARGEIVKNLDDLYHEIINNRISGIGLDVLPQEPPKSSQLIDLWRNNDVSISHKIIINPHTSYYSISALEEMRTKASENAKRIIYGEKPLNIIASGTT